MQSSGGAGNPNQVNLTWRSLQDLGSGDIQITLTYTSSTSQTGLKQTAVVMAEEAEFGYALKWNDPQGITSIQQIQVSKKDIWGNWVNLYDISNYAAQAAPTPWQKGPTLGNFWRSTGPDRVPVYRLYNKETNHHLALCSAADRDYGLQQLSGWIDEGIVGYVSAKPGPSLIPLYRLNLWGTDTHIFTTDPNEVTTKLNTGLWVRAGDIIDPVNGRIDGYVSTDAAALANADTTVFQSLTRNDGQTIDNLYGFTQAEQEELLGLNQNNTDPSRVVQFYGYTAYSSSTKAIGLSIEIGMPPDLASTTTLQYRKANSADVWANVPPQLVSAFGTAYRFDVGAIGLAVGNYDYQVITTNRADPTERTLDAGQFSIGTNASSPGIANLPPIGTTLTPTTDIIDGTLHQVLRWPSPPAGTSVGLQRRLLGSTNWLMPPLEIFSGGAGRCNAPLGTQEAIIDMDGAGTFEYQLIFNYPASGSPFGDFAHAVGNYTVAAQMPPAIHTDITPPSSDTPPVGNVQIGVTTLGGNTYNVLQWFTPTAGSYVEFHYRPHGSSAAWTTRTLSNGIYSAEQGNNTLAWGLQATALNFGAGDFDYEITVYQGGFVAGPSVPTVLANSSGILSVPPAVPTGPTASAYDTTQVDFPIVPNVQTGYLDFNGVNYPCIQWTAAPLGQVAGFNFRPQGSSSWTQRSVYSAGQGNNGLSAGLQASPLDFGAGTFEYEVLYYENTFVVGPSVPPMVARASGVVVVTAASSTTPTLQDTTPRYAPKITGITTGADTINGVFHQVLQWPAPAAVPTGSTATKVYFHLFNPTGVWQWGAPIYQGGDGSSPTPGMQEGIIDAYGPGQYTYILTYLYADGHTAESKGNLTVYAQTPATLVDTTPPYLAPFHSSNQISQANQATLTPTIHQEVDRWGNVLAANDARMSWASGLWRTTYEYNAHNQIIAQHRPQDTQAINTTRIYYDQLGHQVGIKDALGNVNVQTYDAAGRLLQERHADLGQTDYSYNAFGDQVQSRVKMTDTRTIITNKTYDKLSHLTQTELGQAITSYTAALSEPPQGQLGINNPAPELNPDLAIHNANAHASNNVSMASSIQTVLETARYDQAGRKISVTNGNGETTRYAYDQAGNVILSGQEDKSFLTQILSTQLPPGVSLPKLLYTTRYSYDALGRKTSQIDGNGSDYDNTQTWSYTQQGRLIAHTGFDLYSVASTGTAQSSYAVNYHYDYDKAGQLTSQTSTQGQSLSYRYDNAGQLIEIKDAQLGQTSSYTYDLAGNRLSERVTQKTLLPGTDAVTDVVYQDNHLSYDSQSRLRVIGDGRAQVDIVYDAAGNRQSVNTRVTNWVNGKEDTKTSTDTFTYDAMNRQTLGGGHLYRYDLVGNRTYDADATHGDSYTYDDLNRLVSVQRDYTPNYETRQYDGAGRVVYSKSYFPGSDGLLNSEFRYNVFDAAGKLGASRVVVHASTGQATQWNDINYGFDTSVPAVFKQLARNYDRAGNLLSYTNTQDSAAGRYQTTQTYSYAHHTSYQQSVVKSTRVQQQLTTTTDPNTGATTTDSSWSDVAGTSTTSTLNNWYDANGFISNTQQNQGGHNSTFVNDARGVVLYANQGAGAGTGTGRIQNLAGGYQGGSIGDYSNPGHVQRQFVVNGEVLARYGDAPDPASASSNPGYISTAEFSLASSPLQLRGANADPVQYTVVEGESLKSIARAVLGDANLWYTIAQANGLSGSETLSAGQVLTVPKTLVSANNSSIFKPYDPTQVRGDTSPVQPDLVMPSGGGGGGCGGLGQIIMAVVAVVVAVYAPEMFPSVFKGMGTIATAATAAAIGNTASQVVGNAIGAQQGFNWNAVAMSALSAGVTEGLSDVNYTGDALKGWSNTVARAAVGNALTQGIAVATGLQRSFSWTSVAASAVGAGAGYGVGSALEGANLNPYVKAGITSFAAGTAAAVARGGRVSVQQVATDAFGQSLASAVVGNMGRAGAQEDRLGGFISEQLGAQGQRDRSAALYGLDIGTTDMGLRLGSGAGLSYGGLRASDMPLPDDTRIVRDFDPENKWNPDALVPTGMDGRPTAQVVLPINPAITGGAVGGGYRPIRPNGAGGPPGYDPHTDMPTGAPGYSLADPSLGRGAPAQQGEIRSWKDFLTAGLPPVPRLLIGALDNLVFKSPSAESAGNAESSSAPKSGEMPDWLKARFDDGNEFNRVNRARYPYNELEVTDPAGNKFRVDSYDPVAREIVSRKYTQLSEVKPETGIAYLQELSRKYPNGALISDSVFNPRVLQNQRLSGSLILEVPVQNNPIPTAVLDYANSHGMLIRDAKGVVH